MVNVEMGTREMTRGKSLIYLIFQATIDSKGIVTVELWIEN